MMKVQVVLHSARAANQNNQTHIRSFVCVILERNYSAAKNPYTRIQGAGIVGIYNRFMIFRQPVSSACNQRHDLLVRALLGRVPRENKAEIAVHLILCVEVRTQQFRLVAVLRASLFQSTVLSGSVSANVTAVYRVRVIGFGTTRQQ